MHRLTVLALLLLAACARPVPQVAGFRDPARPIYSSAVLLPDQTVGRWDQVADFAAGPGGCGAGGVTITRTGTALQVAGSLCLAGQSQALSGPLTASGPGRFAVAGLTDPLWVLWSDTDRRTLVIGTPSGRFGGVLNRDGALPPDRAQAVREILDFNGYDLDRMQTLR